MPSTYRVGDEVLFDLAQSAIGAQYARQNLDLEAIAEMLGVSRWRLSRAFSRCRMDFRSCVRQARMLSAGYRLRHDDASIKVVAIDVGYRYHSDFTRHFRAHWGMTPTAFRDMHDLKGVAR
jgi:AraC-like DNA-binding protein